MSGRFFFDPRNLLILPRTIIGQFQHADWRGARKRGVAGVVTELARATTGFDSMAFFVPTRSRWGERALRALLTAHGITSWGYGQWAGELYFRTEQRQAHWAQYVMLRAGVPLLHGLMSGSRARPRAGAPQRKARGGFFGF